VPSGQVSAAAGRPPEAPTRVSPTRVKGAGRTLPAVVGTIATALAVFAGTNIDDVIVLTVLFLAARAAGRPRWPIWAGQFTGIALLTGLAAVAALGLRVLPDRAVPLLGLVPLGLGGYGLVVAARSGGERSPVGTGLLAVTAVTLANGADNLAAYTPLFRAIGVGGTLVTSAVFAAGVVLLCLAAAALGAHRRVIAAMERSGRWVVPAVFVLLGALILAS
jgi:cadmium resistance protein CadD (predicted permease)